MAKSSGTGSEKQESGRQNPDHEKNDRQKSTGEDQSHLTTTTEPSPPAFRSRLEMKDYPTPWQRKMMWAVLTACFVVVLVVIVAVVIWAGASIISFLQPILIPVAIAAIL